MIFIFLRVPIILSVPFFRFRCDFYLPHNHALWAHWQIPSAFQSNAKNNHLFFYSHWLCYNAATLGGQTRGQSIISPVLLQAKSRDMSHLSHCAVQSSNRICVSILLFSSLQAENNRHYFCPLKYIYYFIFRCHLTGLWSNIGPLTYLLCLCINIL